MYSNKFTSFFFARFVCNMIKQAGPVVSDNDPLMKASCSQVMGQSFVSLLNDSEDPSIEQVTEYSPHSSASENAHNSVINDSASAKDENEPSIKDLTNKQVKV